MADSIMELRLRRVGLSSESLLVPKEPFRDLLPRPFLYLNLASQLLLRAIVLPSVQPQVLAKKWAFSLTISSVTEKPCRW